MANKTMKMVGLWAFLIGIFGSLLLGLVSGLGLFTVGATMTLVLAVAGLVIGFLNVTQDEAVPMMIASILLGAGTGVLALLPFVGSLISSMLGTLAVTVLPAGVVIAVGTIVRKASQ